VVARVPDGFVIELTYGSDVDWYGNIAAAGGCAVIYACTSPGLPPQCDRSRSY
jgi:hypothetical protein